MKWQPRTSRSFGISHFFFAAVYLLMLASAAYGNVAPLQYPYPSTPAAPGANVWQWEGSGTYPVTNILGTDADTVLYTYANGYYEQLGPGACATTNSNTCIKDIVSATCPETGAPTASSTQQTCTITYSTQCSHNATSCGTLPNEVVSDVLRPVQAQLTANNALCINAAGGTATQQIPNGATAPQSVSVSEATNNCMVQAGNPDGSDVCVTIGGPQSTLPTALQGSACGLTYTGTYAPAAPTNGSIPATTNCVTSGTTTACLQQVPKAGCGTINGTTTCQEPQNCGTFNGNQVCPTAIPGLTCASYASGGTACTLGPGNTIPNPPAPSTSSGAAAAPTGTVTATSNTGTTTTSNYYNSSTVSASGTAVQSASGGTNVGNGGSGTGTSGSGTGTGTQCGSSGTPCSTTNANATADGNCGSVAGGCSTGSNPVPTYDWSGDSWTGALTGFWTAVANGPIGTAVSSIANNWPTNSTCPNLTVTIVFLNNYTANYGQIFCNLWENAAVPVLTGTMLAVWSVTAVFIFLSA